MRQFFAVILSFFLLFGEAAPFLCAKPASLQEKVSKKMKLTPAQTYQRLEERINLFLGEDEEEAETSAAEKQPSAQEEKEYQQAIEQLVKEIHDDWKFLSTTKYKQQADQLWLVFSVALLQQDDWLSFFGGEKKFRKKWFPSLAQFYANIVNQNIITVDGANGTDNLEQRVYFSGLALQNLAALHVQGYRIKKSYWENLAPKAVLSLQSGLVVDLVFPILIQNKSWNALDKAISVAQQREWDGRSSAFWSGVGTVLRGAGIVGVPTLIKQKIDNFDGSRDQVFGAVSRLGNVGWRLSSTRYEPATTTAWCEVHLDGNYLRPAADFVVMTESHSIQGLDSIVCRPNSDGTPNTVSVMGQKAYIFNVHNLQEMAERMEQDPHFIKEGATPMSKSKYAKYSREIMEIVFRSPKIQEVSLAEVVVTNDKKKGKKPTVPIDQNWGKVIPSLDFSSSWIDFAARLEKANPKLLAKHTANLFNNDGKPNSSQIIWPLVLGYLLQSGRDSRDGSKPFKMAQYFARKTWGDVDVETEENLDSRLTHRYPQLACYAAKETKESDSSRQYIMITPERVRGGMNARWGGQVIEDIMPLADAIDWTLIVVSAPTILKSGWRLTANSGRLLVGRPAVLKGGRMVSGSQLLRLSRSRLHRIVRQTSGTMQRSVQNLRKAAAKTVPGRGPAAKKVPARPAAVPGAKTGGAVNAKAVPSSPSKPVSFGQAPSVPVPEAVSSVPEAQIRSALEGPLAGRVSAPRAVRMGDRSLMPSTRAQVKPGWVRESDLVYMEQHATDPNKVVMYYTDDMGRGVTAREVTRTEYDRIVGAMSEADKAGLNQSAKLLDSEIASARLDREYSRLEELGGRTHALKAERMRIASSGSGSRAELARVREIDRELAAIEEEAARTVADISKASGTTPQSVRSVYNIQAEVVTPPPFKPGNPSVRMADRSLMPTTRAQVKPGWTRESDLVYIEQHPTDPSKVVMYYADDAGRGVTAREVTRTEYDRMVGAMSEADKAGLNQSAKLFDKEIASARLDREYSRLEELGGRTRALRSERMRIESSGSGSKAELARVREIDRELAAIEEEAARTVADISKASGTSPRSIRSIYNMKAEVVTPPPFKPGNPSVRMGDRSLMPSTRAQVKPGWVQESDLVYIEQHATDPNKVVMYYTDDMGRGVTAREVTRTEYDRIVGAMSEADKAGLNQSAKLFEKEIASARLDREYDRLEALGKRMKDLRQQLAEVDSSDVVAVLGEGTKVERGARISAEIARLETEANGVIQDIARVSKAKPETVRAIFKFAAESVPAPRAAARKPYYSLQERDLFADYAPARPRSTGVESRADGIVGMERHATDPSITIVYREDAMGQIRVSQWYTSEADKFMASLSDAEKVQLAELGQDNAQALQALRQERAFDDLDRLGNRLKALRATKDSLQKANAPFERQYAVVKQIRELEEVARRMTGDMVRNGFGSEYYIGLRLESAQTSAVQAQKIVKPLSMRDRSLMPSTRAKVDPGWTRKSDLVYMERHPTDPNKVVMYYTDDAGRGVTAREVTRAEYERVFSTMSEADKAGLNQSAKLLGKEIADVRLEREYDRLYALGKEMETARVRLDQVRNNPSFTREGVQLDKRIKALQEEISAVINDISRQSNIPSRELWKMLEYQYPGAARRA